MTENEAIISLKDKTKELERITDNFLDVPRGELRKANKEIEMCTVCISALEEIQQYRAIGTVEKFRKLKEEMNKKILMKEKIIELLYQHMQFLEDKSKSVETDKLIQISESINKIASTINSLSIHV